MEYRDQAETLFRKLTCKQGDLSLDDQGQLAKSVRRLLREYLSKVDRKCRFRYEVFMTVIMTTAIMGRLVVAKASEAFENLEKYFILLYRSPWKREFQTIKTFCGFFQSKIRSHLDDAESIFCLVGFELESPGTLTLCGKPNRNLFLSVAFECVVATVECELLSEHHRKMKEGGSTIEDVVRWRYDSVVPEPRKVHGDNHVQNTKEGQIVGRNPSFGVNNIHTDSVHGVGDGARMTTSTAVDFRYIDDDDQIEDAAYIEGTLEDHVMASMQRLSHTEMRARRPEVQQGHSEDWDYVRMGLEDKYGQKYYDGARGNIIVPRVNPRQGNDYNSDEGIDVEEMPPPVTTFQHQDRSNHVPVGSNPLLVYYPPTVGPVSHGIQSNDTAYASQSSRTLPRGTSRNAAASSSGLYKAQRYTSIAAGELISRNVNDKEASGKGWSCGACTLHNDAGSTICESCGRSRTVGPDVDGPQCGDSTTVCQTCTFENQSGDLECRMCGNTLDKRNAHTYV